MFTLKLILRNSFRHRLRTLLTLLGLAIAVLAYGLLQTVVDAWYAGAAAASGTRLVTRNAISLSVFLPASYESRIRGVDGVTKVARSNWFGGIYQEPKNFFMQNPVVPEAFMAMHPEFVLPPEQMKAWLATRTGAIVGRNTAERFHWKIGDKVPIMSPIWLRKTWEFDIVGIFDGAKKGTDTTSLFFRYDYFDETRKSQNYGTGLVGWYTIRVKDPAKAGEVARLVDEEFANSPAETKTEPEGAFAQGFANQIGNIALIVGGILGAVFFTILLVTGSTMSQAVRERIGELGVLKAIGFTNGQVLFLVLAESCLLTVLGGILGLGLALALTWRGDPTGGMLPLFFLPMRDVLIGLGISVVLGLLTGIFPAQQAMRLQVAEALRRM